MGVGKDHADQTGTRDLLDIIAEHEDIAAADQTDRADAGLVRLAHGDVGCEHAGDVTRSAVAVDARGRRRFADDFRLGAAVQAPGAQFPHRRVNMVGSLNMMAVQIGLDHPLRIHAAHFRRRIRRPRRCVRENHAGYRPES